MEGIIRIEHGNTTRCIKTDIISGAVSQHNKKRDVYHVHLLGKDGMPFYRIPKDYADKESADMVMYGIIRYSMQTRFNECDLHVITC